MSPHRVDPLQAKAMYQAGMSGRAIARHYGVSKQAMTRWLRRWRTEAQTADPGSAPAVAPTPVPPPPAPVVLLATLRTVHPALAAIVEAHTTITDMKSAIYLRVKADLPSLEAGKQLTQERGRLASVWQRPVGIAWP